MSDPRFDRDPNRPAAPYANRESTAGSGSVWVAAIVAILVIAGLAAYAYRGNEIASNPPATTTGQSTQTPASPPPSAPSATVPVAPATPADPAQRP
jgi:hypothetical protein